MLGIEVTPVKNLTKSQLSKTTIKIFKIVEVDLRYENNTIS